MAILPRLLRSHCAQAVPASTASSPVQPDEPAGRVIVHLPQRRLAGALGRSGFCGPSKMEDLVNVNVARRPTTTLDDAPQTIGGHIESLRTTRYAWSSIVRCPPCFLFSRHTRLARLRNPGGEVPRSCRPTLISCGAWWPDFEDIPLGFRQELYTRWRLSKARRLCLEVRSRVSPWNILFPLTSYRLRGTSPTLIILS